jgi:serine/threonine protein phosphatase 1
MTPRVFAIGDIHGCAKTFRKLLIEVIAVRPSDQVYCLGDYIDRGPDSKGVIDFIVDLREKGYRIHTVRGNHEQLMLASGDGDQNFDHWIRNGGDATLQSFGISSYDDFPLKYKVFFDATDIFIMWEKFIFVHAGMNFQIPNPFEDKVAMLWIRDSPVDYEKLGDRIIIHGHTPRSLSFILSQEMRGAINIDGGCVYKDRAQMGNLIAIDLTKMEFITVENIDWGGIGALAD